MLPVCTFHYFEGISLFLQHYTFQQTFLSLLFRLSRNIISSVIKNKNSHLWPHALIRHTNDRSHIKHKLDFRVVQYMQPVCKIAKKIGRELEATTVVAFAPASDVILKEAASGKEMDDVTSCWRTVSDSRWE